ncbi:protein-serine/threonine phosphatase [Malassezia obtusa]|uniref:protein-serine/threonine phosphatase n=1 Tax=Malassezia obtusa TaxID=76774 RepID=A0AAF0DX63_9BASI|nr:protein-serine/threonine phosphatase [Malassezia obtusa]
MGQILSEPIVDKRTTRGEDERHLFCVSDMQGWRISMEDAHAAVMNLPEDANVSPDERANVARYAGRTVHGRLADLPEFKERKWEAALHRAFLKTDEDLRVVAALLVPEPGSSSGRRMYCANSGDSRCVLGLAGEAKPMSYDHKPSNPEEHSRILNAGGFVEFDRVNGNLALSRALGDFEFKQNASLPAEEQIVTADPQVISHDYTGEEEFLVLACDGIWDCLSNQQVVDLVRRGVAQGKELDTITEDIIDRCLAPDAEVGGIGCDNMTLLIVALLGNRSKQEWYEWMKQRVENKVGYETPESVPPVFRSHLQQNPSSQSLFAGGNAPQRNVALSFNGLGSGGLLSAIPRVLAGQNAEEGAEGVNTDGTTTITSADVDQAEEAPPKTNNA